MKKDHFMEIDDAHNRTQAVETRMYHFGEGEGAPHTPTSVQSSK
jgi:hypothetical protein